MIKPRTRKSTNTELTKAKESANIKEMSKFTIYAPLADIDALNLLALKQRRSVSEVMREVIADFLEAHK